MRFKLYVLVAVVVPNLLAGCGSGESIPKLVPVQGTVTINGQPGANLMVSFAPEGQQDVGLSTGKTDEQGNYELRYKGIHSGAPLGRYRVRIQHFDPAEVSEDELLPQRYNDETELSVEVTAEEKSYNFELET
jgi:hypothetical protein